VPLEKNHVKYIVEWNEGKDADFLMQWSGRGYRYPITEEQITGRLVANSNADYKIYDIKLDEKLIGTIELMRIDLAAKKANIGRFDHAKTGKGYGTKAKKLFTGSVFDGTPITKLV
jgi:RimJ/RimL family protein N-acetyltransferase